MSSIVGNAMRKTLSTYCTGKLNTYLSFITTFPNRANDNPCYEILIAMKQYSLYISSVSRD